MTMAAFVLAWAAPGLLSAGFTYAYFQGEFPKQAHASRRQDLGAALLMGILCGPMALIVAYCLSGFGKHGWRLR